MHVATTKRIYLQQGLPDPPPPSLLPRREQGQAPNLWAISPYLPARSNRHHPPATGRRKARRAKGRVNRPQPPSWTRRRGPGHAPANRLGRLLGLAVVGQRSLVPGDDRHAVHCAAVQAGHLPGTEGRDRHHQLGRGIGIGRDSAKKNSTRRWIGCSNAADADRNQARPAAPSGRNIGAQPCQQQLLHGTPCGVGASSATTATASTASRKIVYGLLCNAEGCPVAIEVFEGNTGGPQDPGAANREAPLPLRRASAWCWWATGA